MSSLMACQSEYRMPDGTRTHNCLIRSSISLLCFSGPTPSSFSPNRSHLHSLPPSPSSLHFDIMRCFLEQKKQNKKREIFHRHHFLHRNRHNHRRCHHPSPSSPPLSPRTRPLTKRDDRDWMCKASNHRPPSRASLGPHVKTKERR